MTDPQRPTIVIGTDDLTLDDILWCLFGPEPRANEGWDR